MTLVAIPEDPNLAARRKTVLIAVLAMGGLYTLVTWYATQMVAAECQYNPLLGEHLTLFGLHIYSPYAYKEWIDTPAISRAIPAILRPYRFYPILALVLGAIITVMANKSLKTDVSHGSAKFATKKEIDESGLGAFTKGDNPADTKKYQEWLKRNKIQELEAQIQQYLLNPAKKAEAAELQKKEAALFQHAPKVRKSNKVPKNSGVVVGINPYTNHLMLHDGPEHILLMAPTRSGKGVNTIIPTGITWKASIFFFDPKGELWANTAGYRKNVLGQKVMKFEPLCMDGSTNRWNPLAEINFRTNEEISDVSTIASVMVKPDGEKKGGGDPFWDNSALSLLNGVIMHLMYKHYKEHLPLPCPTDIMSFLSSPDMDTDELFENMKVYPHITPEEFLEEEYNAPVFDGSGNPVMGEDGKQLTVKKKYENPLLKIYGRFYVKNLGKFSEVMGCGPLKDVIEVREAIKKYIADGNTVDWDETEDEDVPFHRLLTHPRVAEVASNMANGADQTRASIMQTAQTALAIYMDPVVQRNTAVSDFCIRDLLDPKQEVSCYLVMQVKDIATVKPISRLFINTLLNKLIRDMKFEIGAGKKKAKKQRLLLMLDEFPQLGNMSSVELALAICAGYGIKICIVCQDVNQLNKAYTKDNSIASNCHVHIYFTPNLDPGGATAKAISETLGKKTIKSVSHSDGGGLGKGSDSISSQGRELMTPDEVSHMSSERELVFVAGHRPIMGKKLRYYLTKYFMSRIQPAPEISDQITKVENYNQLFAIHAADTKDREDKIKKVEKAKLARQQKEAGNVPPAPNVPKEKASNEEGQAPKEKQPESKQEHVQSAAEDTPHSEAPVHEGTRRPRQEQVKPTEISKDTLDHTPNLGHGSRRRNGGRSEDEMERRHRMQEMHQRRLEEAKRQQEIMNRRLHEGMPADAMPMPAAPSTMQYPGAPSSYGIPAGIPGVPKEFIPRPAVPAYQNDNTSMNPEVKELEKEVTDKEQELSQQAEEPEGETSDTNEPSILDPLAVSQELEQRNRDEAEQKDGNVESEDKDEPKEGEP